jgi:excinuclease ABC subunit C
VLKRRTQTASELDEIPGIGAATRKKLIQSFGSLRAVKKARRHQIVAVIGESKTKLLWPHIAAEQIKSE